jgi:hypothetical protein
VFRLSIYLHKYRDNQKLELAFTRSLWVAKDLVKTPRRDCDETLEEARIRGGLDERDQSRPLLPLPLAPVL